MPTADGQSDQKDVKFILSFFQEAMVYQQLAAPQVRAGQGREKQARAWRWYWILVVYVVIGVRGLVLFTMPIWTPDNQSLPYLLGDFIASLGLAVRQMMYSLSLNYSIAMILLKVVVMWCDSRNKLHFVHDFDPQTMQLPITDPGAMSKLRRELKLALIGYRYYVLVINMSVVGQLTLALTLDTMNRR